MKRLILIVASILLTVSLPGQTNSFPPDGNVGIGTTNPSNIQNWNKVLDVFGENHSKILTTTNNTNIKTGIFSHYSWYSGGGFIGTESHHNLHLITGYTPKITILNNGNVGIGTETPKAKLDVSGSILMPSGVNGGAYFKYNYTTLNTNSRSWILANDFYHYGDFGIYQSINQTDDNLQNFAHNYRFYISRDGNVGIGTVETGGHKLAVDGTIGAREIKVETTSWSDFVFEDTYQLRNLEEVESFIEENKHLPDIPSQKDVIENGIQLGEMDAKLLQKIEELMLYTIQQEKKIKKLQEIIDRNGLK
jgi:hypothetical protein